MSDRLQELRRQRALVQEHLAWLDREIAGATGSQAPAPAASSPPTPFTAPRSYLATQAAAIASHAAAARTAPSPAATPENPAVIAAADAILDEYRVPPSSLKTDVRKGCFLYFFAAFAAVAAFVAVLYNLLGARSTP